MSELAAGHVFDVDTRSFQTDVIERSRDVPVFLVFWADQVPVSIETRRHMEKIAESYGGKLRVGRVDVARDRTLVQHLRVQNLPSIKIIRDGQLIDELDGPQGERVLRELADRHTMSSGELVRAQLGELLVSGDLRTARALLERALEEEPGNPVFRIELADLLARAGDTEGAKRQLQGLPDEAEDIDRPRTRIGIVEEVATLPERGIVEAQVADAGDLRARYQLALYCAADGAIEQAFEHALAILRTNRAFEEELGRRTLVRLFGLQPRGDELVKRYRRQLFNLLH